MYVKQLLLNTLNGITFNNKEILVTKLKYTGKEKSYIQYYMLLDSPDYADGKRNNSIVYFTIDIFTNVAEYESLVEEVQNRLEDAGFCVGDTTELFETNTQLYHVIIDVSIEKYEI